jgi:predicted nucleic acid-binding protein
MIVPDSSVWIALLRDSGSPQARELERLIDLEADIAVTEITFMEILSGARDESTLRELRTSLFEYPILTLRSLVDYEAAALLYRSCRRAGETIRNMTDCLIAVVSIRADATVLHEDRDFEAIARHSPLKIHEPKR